MTRTLLKFLLPLLLLTFTPAPVALHAQNASDNSTLSGNDNQDNSEEKKGKKGDKKDDKKEEESSDVNFFTFGIEKFSLAFFTRLLIDLISMVILIRFIYLPVYNRRDHLFTFFMFNIAIFMITNLLSVKSGISTGAAFGMFAVFSLLRYRTEDISARDMTYLFMVIALGLMSSINKGNIVETGIINLIVVVGAFLLDGGLLFKTEFVKTIQYENIELIKPENFQLLLADLKNRTGLNVHKVSIGRIDFLRDTATLKIYYHETANQET
jgi:hypothetical protein